MKNLGGTGLLEGLKKFRGGEDFMFEILENQYKLYYSQKTFFASGINHFFSKLCSGTNPVYYAGGAKFKSHDKRYSFASVA